MIETYLSIQDTIAIGLALGILIKLFQFFYFDKKRGKYRNNGGKK